MGKGKSQVSLFIIIGLIIVFAVTFMFLYGKRNVGTDGFREAEVSFSDSEIEEYVNRCLEETSLEALKKSGFNEEIGNYIDANLGECILGFEYFKDTGYEFTEGVPKANVLTDNDYLTVDLDYPLKISKDNRVTELTVFHYSLKNIETLNAESGIFKKDDLLISPDKRLVLRFDEDTNAKDVLSGNPIEQISMKSLDRQYDDMENSIVIGNLIYEGGPDGTIFDKPIDITIQLDEMDSKAYDPETFTISYFDEETGIWIAYPESYYDKETNSMKGKINHFTKIAVTICSQKGFDKIYIPLVYAFKDPFGPQGCDPMKWEENEFEDGIHIKPEFMNDLDPCIFQTQKEDASGKKTDLEKTKEGETKTKEMRLWMNTLFHSGSSMSDSEFDTNKCPLDTEYFQDWDQDDIGIIPAADIRYRDLTKPSKPRESYPINPPSGITKQDATDCLSVCRNDPKILDKISQTYNGYKLEYLKTYINKETDQIADGIKDDAKLLCTYEYSGTSEEMKCDSLSNENKAYWKEVLATPNTFGILHEFMMGRGTFRIYVDPNGGTCAQGFPQHGEVQKYEDPDEFFASVLTRADLPVLDNGNINNNDFTSPRYLLGSSETQESEVSINNDIAFESQFEGSEEYNLADLQAEEWSCSDKCIWSLNQNYDQENSKAYSPDHGRFVAGRENVLSVDVYNINDACMYARGILEFNGIGLQFDRESIDEYGCAAISGCFDSTEKKCFMPGETINNDRCCVPAGENMLGFPGKYDHPTIQPGVCNYVQEHTCQYSGGCQHSSFKHTCFPNGVYQEELDQCCLDTKWVDAEKKDGKVITDPKTGGPICPGTEKLPACRSGECVSEASMCEGGIDYFSACEDHSYCCNFKKDVSGECQSPNICSEECKSDLNLFQVMDGSQAPLTCNNGMKCCGTIDSVQPFCKESRGYISDTNPNHRNKIIKLCENGCDPKTNECIDDKEIKCRGIKEDAGKMPKNICELDSPWMCNEKGNLAIVSKIYIDATVCCEGGFCCLGREEDKNNVPNDMCKMRYPWMCDANGKFKYLTKTEQSSMC